MMSSVYSVSDTSESPLAKNYSFVLAKGAPEAITKRCTHYLSQGKNRGFDYLNECPTTPMSDDFVEFLSQSSAKMASCGLRVLAMAIRKVSVEKGAEIIKSEKHAEAEKDLIFAGLIGLIDPPKYDSCLFS